VNAKDLEAPLGNRRAGAIIQVLDHPQAFDSKDGEMSEWLKEHAWKSISAARADPHRNPPTHFRSTTSRNNDLLQRVPVNDGVAPGFRGVCDTVLTQSGNPLTSRHTNAHQVTLK
jgi:hypothetical protein